MNRVRKPTEQEVVAELDALRELNPVGQFARKTAASIQIAIDALLGNVDETSDEFNSELTDDQQQAALDAINWKNGDSDTKPSEGWGNLVET